MIQSRKDDKAPVYVDPTVQLNIGLWTLFAGATVFLALRVWIKLSRRHGLWWDDNILLVSWVILAANNGLITAEYATGYVSNEWDDRMHILINISSCGTLIGQALTKTAFAVTLLKLTEGWQQWVLWFCIASMNTYMIIKVFFQWAKICDKPSYDVWYRLDFCLPWEFREKFKEGGNVYNIIMDFALATFPWIITWNLGMRRVEKIGLCVTMSLGMIVAIVSAIRTGWKSDGNQKDAYYFLRNAHSNIWYSSEIVGTIIVQCIPVLRPLIRDMHTSITSRKLASSAGNTARQSRFKPPQGFEVTDGPQAQIYSDADEVHRERSRNSKTVSWDSQRIYHKKEFELTTWEFKEQKETSPV